MDRIDAMEVFVAALDEGSLAAAGRRLGRSPAAVTRAVHFLEDRLGARLLHRTTRAITLTEAGARYAETCRRVLADLSEAEMHAAGDRAAPRGVLTLTAPIVSGTRILRPILDGFLDHYGSVQARLLLLDRPVHLVDEGIDVALRIAQLPDSSLIAVRLGEVRRVVCAAPAYLRRRPAPTAPEHLVDHDCVSFAQAGEGEVWNFPPAGDAKLARPVRVRPRLTVNTIEAAVGSAIDGHGITRVYSYQVEQEVRDGRLVLLLEDCEPPKLPVHLIVPEGRLAIAKVRAFVDFATPRLRAEFARIATP
ncbi:MAG TPA: LysR family transcriptional regulator [Aliidongia sp.]|nr:LysR family transcriptional regulator [Aliidongia sp.]